MSISRRSFLKLLAAVPAAGVAVPRFKMVVPELEEKTVVRDYTSASEKVSARVKVRTADSSNFISWSLSQESPYMDIDLRGVRQRTVLKQPPLTTVQFETYDPDNQFDVSRIGHQTLMVLDLPMREGGIVTVRGVLTELSVSSGVDHVARVSGSLHVTEEPVFLMA